MCATPGDRAPLYSQSSAVAALTCFRMTVTKKKLAACGLAFVGHVILESRIVQREEVSDISFKTIKDQRLWSPDGVEESLSTNGCLALISPAHPKALLVYLLSNQTLFTSSQLGAVKWRCIIQQWAVWSLVVVLHVSFSGNSYATFSTSVLGKTLTFKPKLPF